MINNTPISVQLQKARDYQDQAVKTMKLAKKPYFHVAAPVGWINDPNGFSCYQGEVHLFYQYHPYDYLWGPMHWGHVKTTDFIRWEQLPVALAPDQRYDDFGCFSGSAVEWKGKHVLVYTGVSKSVGDEGYTAVIQTQCIAVGDGIDYEKIDTNPVILSDSLPKGSSTEDFRDPKAWVVGDEVYLVVGSRAEDSSGQIPLYRSKNLSDWEFLGIIDQCNNQYGKMWECPDFFELDGKQILLVSPQEMKGGGMEIHNGNTTLCIIGNFDSDTYAFQRESVSCIDSGLDFYAPQTMMTEDGRRIMIGWMESWDNHMYTKEFGWSGMMTIPRELSIVKEKLHQNPIREIEKYYKDTVTHSIGRFEGSIQLSRVEGRCSDLSVEVVDGEYQEFSIYLACGKKEFTRLCYDRRKGIFEIDRENSGLARDVIGLRRIKVADREGKIKLRVILDRYSIEVFINDGEQALSTLIFTEEEANGIEFHTDGYAQMEVLFHQIQV